MYLAGTSYTEVYSTFRWGIPPRFNIAEAVCTRYARTSPDAPALIYEQADGSVRVWSFREIEQAANRFANALAHLGVERGTIVGIHLPQCPESLISHVAVQKLGGISLPMFNVFGPDAIGYRLSDSAARVLITTSGGLERLGDSLSGIETLAHVISIGAPAAGSAHVYWDLLEQVSDSERAT